jgi:hypothetical protein
MRFLPFDCLGLVRGLVLITLWEGEQCNLSHAPPSQTIQPHVSLGLPSTLPITIFGLQFSWISSQVPALMGVPNIPALAPLLLYYNK